MITEAMMAAVQALALPPHCRVRLFSPANVPVGIYQCWCQSLHETLQEDGVLQEMFWWQQHRPDAAKGSLEDLLTLCRSGLILTLDVLDQASNQYRGAGVLVLNEIIPQVKAQATVWYARGLTTHAIRHQVTRAVVGWVFASLGLREIWAQTLSPRAVAHFHACGAETLASIPGYAWYQGQAQTVHILRLTADHMPEPEGHANV